MSRVREWIDSHSVIVLAGIAVVTTVLSLMLIARDVVEEL